MGFFDIFKRKKDKKQKEKYKLGLHKTREGALSTLSEILSKSNKIDDDLFDSLEEVFIMADIGVDTVVDFIDELKEDVKTKNITNPDNLKEIIIDKMFEIYLNGEIVNANLNLNKEGLSVILFVGVNGVGKTTSIAKIANQYKKEGKKVLLAAVDTFRAGAIEQLEVWAKRVGVDIVTHEAGSDPSSVMYDAIKKAKNENYDILLCDTAGRLQNKVNLMNELSKMKRVLEKELPGAPHETLLVIVDTAGRLQNKVNLMNELSKMKRVMGKIIPDAPHETFLIIDANTGQNGVEQARVFKEVTPISGIVITKMDGTSKGGIILAIREKLGIPVRFIGLGEGIDDLKEFDLDSYLYGLLIGDDDE